MRTQLHIPFQSHLQDYVTGIWEVNGSAHVKEKILPQGVIEIVFNLGDPMTGVLPFNTNAVVAPYCFIQGINTHVVDVVYTGKQHLFGIRLQPHLVKSVAGIIPSDVSNVFIDMTLINRQIFNLSDQLVHAICFQERINIVERFFPVLKENTCARSRELSKIFLSNNINDFNCIDNLSKQVYYSSRQLNRKSQDLFGFSAEELIGYKKFMYSIQLMHADKKSLTDIAYESNFYDQAHFCRIFKNYTGITPGKYRSRKSALPFHLFS